MECSRDSHRLAFCCACLTPTILVCLVEMPEQTSYNSKEVSRVFSFLYHTRMDQSIIDDVTDFFAKVRRYTTRGGVQVGDVEYTIAALDHQCHWISTLGLLPSLSLLTLPSPPLVSPVQAAQL